MAFPGFQTLQRFLTKTTVGPDTRATYWLLCIESDVQKVEELLATLEADTQHCVYPAKRCAQTIVFVSLQWDCTFAQLETVFGTPLLGKVIQKYCFQELNNFLRGAKATKVEEWSIIFSIEKPKFSQDTLNRFAIELNIDSDCVLVNFYSELSLLFNTRICSRLYVSVTEQDADRLFKDHFRNARAFMGHSRQLCFSKTAVKIVREIQSETS